MASKSTLEKLLPEVARYGGHVLQASLSNEAEQHLREAADAAGAERG